MGPLIPAIFLAAAVSAEPTLDSAVTDASKLIEHDREAPGDQEIDLKAMLLKLLERPDIKRKFTKKIEDCARKGGVHELPAEKILTAAVDHLIRANGLSAVVCVKLKQTAEINAGMLKAGYEPPLHGIMFVNEGLIRATQNDSQLMAALGHELAHLVRHRFDEEHKFPQIAREKEADRLGLRYLAAAGYDPLGAAAMHINAEAIMPERIDDNATVERDHPRESFRIEDMRYLAEAVPTNPNYPHPDVRTQLRALGY